MSRLGWCVDGDRPLFYGQKPNMALHNDCRNGQTVHGKTLECDCWHHTGATKPPKKTKTKQVKRNGRSRMVVNADTDPSKAGKKGYSKNGKKLGRPKGSKNRVKVKAV